MKDVSRRLISLRRRSWDFGTSLGYYVPRQILEKSVGKVNPLRNSCVSAFSRLSLFGKSGMFVWYDGITYINPKLNPNI